MKNIKTGTYFYNDESQNFEFATDLSAHRKLMFVSYVVNSLVSEDRYDSIVKDLVFDFGLIAIMTDIDTSFINVKDEDGDTIICMMHYPPINSNKEHNEIIKLLKNTSEAKKNAIISLLQKDN